MAFDAPPERPAWSIFDADWYVRTYRESLAGIPDTPAAVEAFYHENGVKLRHSPNPFFDEAWYVTTNADVAEAIERGTFASGFEHYGLAGHNERSPHWLFSEAFYVSENDDLTADILSAGHYANGYDHYLRTGDAQYRSGHWLFDPHMHRIASIEDTSDTAGQFRRFVTGNRRVASIHRLSWYFDPVWYQGNYPEVYDEISKGTYSCALEHYLCNSTPTEYNPNAHFSEEFYYERHHDVRPLLESGQIRNCFEHFLRYGAVERRQPSSSLELEAYFRNPTVQTEINQGFYRDAFAHFEGNFGRSSTAARLASIGEEDAQHLYAATCNQLIPTLIRRPLDFTYDQSGLSVIIVAHNQFALTMTTLASLRTNYPGSMQVILVDSGSRDEIRQIESHVKGLDVIRFGYNAGYVVGCNAALQLAKANSTLYLNNDTQLAPLAIENALARLWSNEMIGAVGGKLIRAHGKLQEAGSIIWRDGWCTGYLRDEDPNVPEANFARPVDFCSAAFLLCKSHVLREIGGFDVDYSPAYFEDADLGIRMRQAGYMTFYDPTVCVQHYERATSRGSLSTRLIERNQPIFRRKNAGFLRHRPFNHPLLLTHARAAADNQRRILFFEDRLPFRHLGSGFVRSNDILHVMVKLGYHVTLYPIFKAVETKAEIYKAFPDTVEVIHDRDLADLEGFLVARSKYFDMIWIGRTHNAERLAPVFARSAAHIPTDHVILDTEALASVREAERRRILQSERPEVAGELKDESEPIAKMVQEELSCAFVAQSIVAVNPHEANLIQGAGFANVHVLGHVGPSCEPSGDWSSRRDILFLGAIPDESSPNLDALAWFSSKILPILDSKLPRDVNLTVAGHFTRRVDFTPLRRNSRVRLLRDVSDIAPLYASHRVLVAPTRFAAGIPYKVHEAASYGLPIVASALLIKQVGWEAGRDIILGDIQDPDQFADAVAHLYESEEVWKQVQTNALNRIQAENGQTEYEAKIAHILGLLYA